MEHFDVLIIGAGLSGIGAGAHLRMECPSKTFAILEGRERSGGTWDLFRYPGIRSDSDMFTLGYSFRPWKEQKAIADGPSILNYIRETAKEYDLEKEIRFDHRVKLSMMMKAGHGAIGRVLQFEAVNTDICCRKHIVQFFDDVWIVRQVLEQTLVIHLQLVAVWIGDICQDIRRRFHNSS